MANQTKHLGLISEQTFTDSYIKFCKENKLNRFNPRSILKYYKNSYQNNFNSLEIS